MVQRNAFILETEADSQMIESGEKLIVAMFYSICISFYIDLHVNMQLCGSTLLYISNNLDVHIYIRRYAFQDRNMYFYFSHCLHVYTIFIRLITLRFFPKQQDYHTTNIQ